MATMQSCYRNCLLWFPVTVKTSHWPKETSPTAAKWDVSLQIALRLRVICRHDSQTRPCTGPAIIIILMCPFESGIHENTIVYIST